MEIITDLNQSNILLKKYSGAKVQIWLFNISHKKIIIKLTMAKMKRVIYIIGVSCEYIKGSFSWASCNLNIINDIDKEKSIPITKVLDKENDFELITSGGIVLAHGYESEFGTTFDDFLEKQR